MKPLSKPSANETGSPDRASITDVQIGLPPAAARAYGWGSALVGLGVAIPILVAVFWEASYRAVLTWYGSSTFNHGFLILPICMYLIWTRRSELAAVAPRPNLLGLAGLALIGFGWLLADAAGVILVQQLALVAAIQLLTFTVLGWAATRIIWFGLFYLYFAVPFGDFLIGPLQDFTAVFVVKFLRTIGIPVFLDGIFISIPGGNFEVAEACSGVRFLIATVALGFLFAYLNYQSIWRRIAFVGLSFVVPIIANGFRAFGIVYIAYLTDNEVAVGVDHIVYGWVFFALITVILLAVGAIFRDAEPAIGSRPLPESDAGGGPYRLLGAAALGVVVAGTAPFYAWVLERSADGPERPVAIASPSGEGWQVQAGHHSSWRPRFPNADARLMTTYEKGAKSVQLFIAYYMKQQNDAELISYQNSFEGGNHWARAQSGTRPARVDGEELTVGWMRLLRGPRGKIVWYWYWVDGIFTADPYVAKFLQARAKLLGRSRAGAAIAVATDYTDQPGEGHAALGDFLKSLDPLSGLLRQAPGQ